jgi:hypothetical protein
MDVILECTICLLKYDQKERIPRILKCGHTFCTKCLKELSKANHSIDLNLPFIKCPLDKQIGHSNTKIEEIPINRIIVDILDYNGTQIDQLTLTESKKSEENLYYLNSAKDKLKDLQRFYTQSYNTIKDKVMHFLTIKNNLMTETAEHYDKLITILEQKKAETLITLENYSREKLSFYHSNWTSLENILKEIEMRLESIEKIKNQKLVNKIPLGDEIEILNSLNIDYVDNKQFKGDVEAILKELKEEFLPKLLLKNECTLYITLNSRNSFGRSLKLSKSHPSSKETVIN